MRARTGLVAGVASVLPGSGRLAEQAASGCGPARGIRFIGGLIGPEDPETLEVRRIFRHPRVEGFASSTAATPIGGEIRPGMNRGGMIAGFPAPDPGTAR